MASCDGILGTGRSAPSRRGVPGTQRRDEKSMRLQREPSLRSASRWEGEGSGVIPRPTESRRKAHEVAWRPSTITSLQGLRPGASRPLALHDGKELRSCAGIVSEDPARRRSDNLAARFLDSPHGHAVAAYGGSFLSFYSNNPPPYADAKHFHVAENTNDVIWVG